MSNNKMNLWGGWDSSSLLSHNKQNGGTIMKEYKLKTCETCIKSDVCSVLEGFVSASKEASELQQKYIDIEVIVRCNSWAPTAQNFYQPKNGHREADCK